MYTITKDGSTLSNEDKARYVKLQPNGILVLCDEAEAHGVVVNNDYACHLEGRPEIPGAETVSIREFDGPRKLNELTHEGAKIAQAATDPPAATVGVFAEGFDEWRPGVTYAKQYSLFTHDGKVGFTRQPNITAQAHQPPFSPGMESVYGVRPVPDDRGVYPYVYNMAANEGMRVREGEDVYRCTRDIDPLLYPPSQVPAHFDKEDGVT